MEFTLRIKEDESLVMRPVNKLSDASYERLKRYIESMGGHWREKEEGFIFHSNIINDKAVPAWQESAQFFPTPDKIAKRVAELSGLWLKEDKACKILEPSAGRGSLIRQLPKAAQHSIVAVEPEKMNSSVLVQLLDTRKNMELYEVTFETFYEKTVGKQYFTHVVMNPPFSQHRDVKHVMMAYDFLADGGRLVAIVSENSLYYKNEQCQNFRNWLEEKNAIIESIEPGAFKESGTTVDTVILVINK